MIVGCKKTLVEYRGWVNRNRYYIRIPIRMGGLFSRNDFVQRLTRPEYFPIATSPQKPHHTAISHNPLPNHTTPYSHFPTPIPLKKFPLHLLPPHKTPTIPPISPTLPPQSHLLSTLFPKIP